MEVKQTAIPQAKPMRYISPFIDEALCKSIAKETILIKNNDLKKPLVEVLEPISNKVTSENVVITRKFKTYFLPFLILGFIVFAIAIYFFSQPNRIILSEAAEVKDSVIERPKDSISTVKIKTKRAEPIITPKIMGKEIIGKKILVPVKQNQLADASPSVTGTVKIATNMDAKIYIDGEPKGDIRANDYGTFRLSASEGDKSYRVYIVKLISSGEIIEKPITVYSGQTTSRRFDFDLE